MYSGWWTMNYKENANLGGRREEGDCEKDG